MNKTFALLFYVKKSKKISDGTAPIYLRITIDGKLTEIAAKRYVIPEKWNSQAQKLNGTSEEVKALNAYLKTLEQQVYDAHHELLKDKKQVSAGSLKAKLQGKDERQLTIVPIFEDHIRKMKALPDEYAPATITRYNSALKHLKEYLRWKYSVADFSIKAIDHAFINEFEFYLRSVRKCGNNSAVKYVRSNFGKVIRVCLSNGWLDKDPFINYTSKIREVKRLFLTEAEIEAIAKKDFKNERLKAVRDIFLFSCYTGLAYIDVQQLTPSNVAMGIDGEKWIYTFRQKTDSQSNIPLLPPALEILQKYKDHPVCINKGRLFPVLSNQKMNAYLKEIADVCEIDKELTFHIARHTFATTVTLSNGVPIETVSKMLGHSNIKQTQHYAKILDRKVSDDMKLLRQKFQPKAICLQEKTG